MVMRRLAFTLVALVCLAGGAFAQAPAVTSLTFPALTGRVVDGGNLLSAADRSALTSDLADLEAKTTDQLVVVTLPSLQGTTIEDYGYQLGRRWKIGQKDKDSGVLLIVAAAERKVRVEVGYGLEGTLTDAATKVIIENTILPAFRTGDFPLGIRNGATQIAQMLRADAGTAPRPPGQAAPAAWSGANGPVWPMILLGVFGVGLLIFCAVSGGAACRGIMHVLFIVALSGRGGSSGNRSSSFSGGGGSFGGGGSSGSW
jgi:uncharacterized protein